MTGVRRAIFADETDKTVVKFVGDTDAVNSAVGAINSPVNGNYEVLGLVTDTIILIESRIPQFIGPR